MKYLMLVCVDRKDSEAGDLGRPAGAAPEEIDVDAWVEEMDGRGVRLHGEPAARRSATPRRCGCATARCC